MFAMILDLSSAQLVFLALLVGLAVQRGAELVYSRRNEVWLRSHGAREHAPEHFVYMKLTHSLWFVAQIAEVFLLERAFTPALAVVAVVGLVAGQILRYAAIVGLGRRWSVRIFTLPAAPAVSGGLYRYVRHPNYAGVCLEIAAVPLFHGAYLTALVFSALNAAVLYVRIRAEERALRESNNYDQFLGKRPRFVPGVRKL